MPILLHIIFISLKYNKRNKTGSMSSSEDTTRIASDAEQKVQMNKRRILTGEGVVRRRREDD